MKSPFPGMDPYLEQRWRDVHTRLALYSCDEIQTRLPADLFAHVEERVYVENEGLPERSMSPDVRVLELPHRQSASVAVLDEIEIAEPYLLSVENEPVTEIFIEIREVGTGNRIITTIEYLSKTNKLPGEGRQLYQKKLADLRNAGVSLVEIDLLRLGGCGLSIAPHEIPAHIRAPYHVIIRRGSNWGRAEIYPLPLRQRLPAFRIPLRPSDSDVTLDLQAIVEMSYVKGRYDTLIDHQQDPDPPLEGHEAEWADELLRAAGRRK